MTSLLLLLALLMPSPAAALRVPAAAEVNAIQREIDAGRGIKRDRLDGLQKRVRDYEERMGLRDSEGNRLPAAPPFVAVLHRLNETERAGFLALLRETISTQEEMESHFNAAIRLALPAYGISDSRNPPSGRILSGPPKPDPFDPDLLSSYLGQKASWEPKFTDELAAKSKRYGMTGHDGVTGIGIDAFTYPGKLAATLYHEKQHYQDFTTAGMDLRNLPATEVRIREHVARFERTIFKLNPTDLAEQAETLAVNRAAVSRWQYMIDSGFDPYRKSNLMQLNATLRPRFRFPGAEEPPADGNYDEALASIRERAELLGRRVEQDAEERRRNLEEAARLGDSMRRANEVGERLRSLAELFCEYPFMAEMNYGAQLGDWRNVIQELETSGNLIDIDAIPFKGTCVQYLSNQARLAKQRGLDPAGRDWLVFAVKEGLLRAQGAPPLRERERAGTSPSSPQPVQPTPPAQPPPPAIDDPDEGTPSPPSTPHCRYHDWCKDPEGK